MNLSIGITDLKHGGILTLGEERLLSFNNISDVSNTLIIKEGLVIVLKRFHHYISITYALGGADQILQEFKDNFLILSLG
jgi:hypothetical protein